MERPLPLVTIGASNYNNAQYVIETLESIKAQTYQNIELIVIDDCSTDNSPALIKEWLVDYNKPYRFIENKVNSGLPAVLNLLISNAKGKYISEVATDDILMPDKIRIQVNILEGASADVGGVYSDAYIINEKSELSESQFLKLKGYKQPPSGNIYEDILSGNFWFHYSTAMVKTECYKSVGPFDLNLIAEDVDMLLRLSRSFKFLFSDYVSEKYRVRSNSLTKITNWYPSQLQICAKNLEYSKTALWRMDSTAASAYFEGDSETLALLPKYKHQSAYIRFIILLRNMHVPKTIGKVLLLLCRMYLRIYRTFVG
ncbi:MAG TPA: glycosyltransferase family 2 protein [Bacteroidia bacterium]|jgi:glycosyltransferase involved in cell wall biosynthesis|nr:glycosyltransferase family 2 protein [Bacteroidia bacterium]